MKKLAILILSVLFTFSLSAQVEYIYDFNSLQTGTQCLNGQDGWSTHYQTAGSSQDFDVDYTADGGITPDESIGVWYPYGGPGVGRTATRKASPNFNFSFLFIHIKINSVFFLGYASHIQKSIYIGFRQIVFSDISIYKIFNWSFIIYSPP